jgi:hypothetical protein
LAKWRELFERHLSAIQAGESPGGADYFLRLVQARRDSGEDGPDVALFRIAWLAHGWADDAFATDEKLSELDDKMEKSARAKTPIGIWTIPPHRKITNGWLAKRALLRWLSSWRHLPTASCSSGTVAPKQFPRGFRRRSNFAENSPLTIFILGVSV